jgi:hypothetical protein
MKKPQTRWVAVPMGSEEYEKFVAAFEVRTPVEYEGKRWLVIHIEQRPSYPSEVFVRLQHVDSK